MAKNPDQPAQGKALGTWLRAARERRNTTEAQLAKHLDTEQSMIAMIEKGEADPSPELAAKLRTWIQNGTRPGPATKRGAYAK